MGDDKLLKPKCFICSDTNDLSQLSNSYICYDHLIEYGLQDCSKEQLSNIDSKAIYGNMSMRTRLSKKELRDLIINGEIKKWEPEPIVISYSTPFLQADERSGKFFIMEDNSRQERHSKKINSIEIRENGEIVTSSGKMGATIGAVAAGGTGAVLGAIFGKKNKNLCNKLEIVITYKSGNNIDYVNLLKKPVRKNSTKYDEAIKYADAIKNVLSKMILREEQKEKIEKERVEKLKNKGARWAQHLPDDKKTLLPETSSINEIEKIQLLKEYKSLLDQGIINQDDFEKKKKEIL